MNSQKLLKSAGVLVIAVLFVGLVTATSMAAITGSAHDFSSETWAVGGEICNVCHTPHNVTDTLVPLWNHTTTSATFSLFYDSPTLDAGDVGAPDGASKACLSCHDGTVALDSFGGAGGSSGPISGDANLGTDLSDDHPVSFTYDSALVTADGGLEDPAALTAEVQLFAGKVECASCHDVHDSAGLEKLLVKSNTGSALCLTCHTK